MTLIVYKNGELIADHRVVEFKDHGKVVKSTKMHTESKIKITPNKHFAYVYDNDQDDANADIIMMALELYENGKNIDEILDFKFKNDFIMMVLSAKRAYYVSFNNEDGFRISHYEGTYISPNQRYDFYNAFRLTATEIFDCLAYNQQYCIDGNKTLVTRKDLIPIKKKKV